MGRVRLSVRVYYPEEAKESKRLKLEPHQETVPSWAERCESDLSFDDFIPRIVESFKRIYPESGELNVKYLNDGWWDVIELCGPIGEVFEDKATGNADIRTSIVRVIREYVPVAERQNWQRDASVAPKSSARPQDRRLRNTSKNSSSDITWGTLRPTEDAERTIKRQRLNKIASRVFQDSDKPFTSCEDTSSAKVTGLSQRSRYDSPVHLVEDSQRSPSSRQPNAYATPTSLSISSPKKAPDLRHPVITIPDSGATTPVHIDLDANDTKSEFLRVESVHDVPTAQRRGSPELAAIAGAEDSKTSRTGCQHPPIGAQPDAIAFEKVSLGGHLRHDYTWPSNINGHVREADLAPEVIESRFAQESSFDSSNSPRQSQPTCSREMVEVMDPWSKRDGRLTRPTHTPKQPKKLTLIDSEQQKKLSSIWDPIDSDTENSLQFKAQRRPNGRLTSSQLPLTSSNLASSQRGSSLRQGSELKASATNGSSTSTLERHQRLPGSGIPAALSQRGTPGSILFADTSYADVSSSSQVSRAMVGGEPNPVLSLSSVHQRIYTPPNSQGVMMRQASKSTSTTQRDGWIDLNHAKTNQTLAKDQDQEMFDVEKAEEDTLLNESLRTEALSLSGIGKEQEQEPSEKGMLFKDVTTANISTNRSGQAPEEQQQCVEEGTSIETTPKGLVHTEEETQNQTDETFVSREAEEEACLLWQEMQIREQKVAEAKPEKVENERAKEEQRVKVEKGHNDRKAKEEKEARKTILAKERVKDQENKAKETMAKERKAKSEEKNLTEKTKLERKAKEEERARMAEVARQEAKVKAQKAMDERKKAKAQEHAERQAQELAASIATHQRKGTTTGDPSRKRKSLFTQEGSVKATKPNPRTPQISSDPITEQDRKRKSMTPVFPDSCGTNPPLTAPANAISSEYNHSLMPQPNSQRNLPSALRQSPSILRRSVSFANDSVDTPETLAPSRSISQASISSTPSRALGSSPIRSIVIGDRAANDKINLRERSSTANGKSGKSSKAIKTYSTKVPSAIEKVQSKITQTITRDVKLKGKMPEPAMTASNEIVISSDSENSVSSYYSGSEGKYDVGNIKAGPSSRMKKRRQDTRSDKESGGSDEGIPILHTQTKSLFKKSLQPTITIPSKLASHTNSEGEAGATPSSRLSRSPARYDVDKSATPESIISESGSQSDQDSEDGPEFADGPSRSLLKSGPSNSIAVSSSMPPKTDKADAKAQEKTAKWRSRDRATSSEGSKSSAVKAKRPSPSGRSNGKRVEDEVDQQLQREIRLSGERHTDKKPSSQATANGGSSKATPKPPSSAKPTSTVKPDPRAGGIQHFPSLTDIRCKPEIYKGWEPPPEDRRPAFMRMQRNGVTEAAKAVDGSDDSTSESDDDSSDDDSGDGGADAGKGKGGKSLGRLLKLSKLLPSSRVY